MPNIAVKDVENMAAKILSIAIPTFRRPAELTRLLASIKMQLDEEPGLASRLRLYVYDNDSQDSTSDVVARSGLDAVMNYSKNAFNIGGDPNIFQAYSKTPGDYIWVIGDDDVICEGGIHEVLEAIDEHSPSLIIAKANDFFESRYQGPFLFENYKALVDHMIRHCIILLYAQTLISRNIVKGGVFDIPFAASMLRRSRHPHLHGIVNGVLSDGGLAVYCRHQTIDYIMSADGLTEERVDPKDKELAVDGLRACMTNSTFSSVAWIAERCGHPGLDVYGPLFPYAFAEEWNKPFSVRKHVRLAFISYYEIRRRFPLLAKMSDAIKTVLGYKLLKRLQGKR
jgi:glycosyltransferase involved in cell wall biosynthesis